MASVRTVILAASEVGRPHFFCTNTKLTSSQSRVKAAADVDEDRAHAAMKHVVVADTRADTRALTVTIVATTLVSG